MNEPEDVVRRLEQWGTDDQPAADGAYANRLDTDLRDLHRATADRQRPIWQPAILAFAAGLIVFAGIFAFMRDSSDDIEVVMGASTRTELVLPGGEIIAAEAGLALPDGTRISVGEDGSAVVADVVLEPGSEAIVTGGRLEILVDERPSPPELDPSDTTQPEPRPTTTTRPPADETTTTLPSTRPADTSTDRTTSTTPPRSTTTSATTPQTSTPPTSTDRTTTTTAPDPAVELSWIERDGRVRLSWTYVGPDSLTGWQVTTTSGDRTRTLAVLRDPSARAITVERVGDASVTYRVSARDSGGAIIAESNPVTVS